jgi:hypothetical protein
MGDYHLPAPAGLDHGGLRGRHLQLLHAHIGDLDHPATPHTTAATTATGISPHAPRWESTQSRPAALESTRPYDRAGGLRRPSALEQQRLEQVFPRTGDGAFQRFPDPRGHAFQLAAPIRAYNRTNPRNAFLTDLGNADWVRRVNGGWGVDEARLYNCLDVAASVLASWHGRPTVAAAVHDAGSGLQVEERGTDRVGNWLDAGWRIHRAPDGAAPRPSQVWNAVADRLRTGGHGSSAIVVFRRPNGNNHAVNAVNHHGRILWIDAQRGRVSEKPLYRGTSFMSIELGPDFRPIDRVPTLREAYAYPRPTHPRTAPATAPKQRPMTAESTVALPAGDTPAPLTVETGPAAGDWAAGVATALDKAAAAVTVTAAEAEEFARIRAERPAALDADPETRTVHSVPASQSESAADLPARPPWYVGRGMLGETAVSGVAEWDAAEAATWADDLTEDLDAPVRTQAAAALRDMLAENRPETWRELLVYGRAVNAGGRVLWLRPVLADPSELAVDETAAGPVREYRVQWSSTAVDSFRSRMSSTALEAILFAALTIGSSAASTLVLGVPRITAESAAEASEASAHNLITGRKVFVDGTTRFAGGLRMRIFVDGAEHTPDRTVPRGLVVEFPSVFTGPHEPEARAVADAAGETPLGTARPRPAGEVLNAIDVTPVVARLHRQLRGAGLSAQTVLAVSADAQKLINEPTFRDRSRILLTGGDPSNEIRHGEKLAGLGGFRGHFRTRITLSGAQLLDVTDDVKVRDDLGTGSSATFGAGGESSAALTFGLNAAGLVDPALQAPDHRTIAKGLAPLAALTLSGGRSWDYSLASQALAHTVLNTRAPHARYGAELTVTLDWISSTHPGLGSMSSAVRGDLGVPWRDGQGAADFERRALGGVRSPHVRDAIGGPHPLPGPVAAQPHVRALLQISEAPPVRHEVVPRRLASWRPAPHPDEPLALGRDSLGFAVAAALPGAELVEGYFRWRLETLSGRESSRVDWAALDRRLLVLFGRTALEGDLGNVLAGLLHHVTVGNRRFVLAVRAHLLDRRRTTPHTMTVNNRAALSETLDSRREGRWAVTVGGGGAVRLKLLDQLLLQLGGFRLQGRIAGGKGESFASVTTSYRRKETVGDTVESVRDVVYELTLRSADGGRPFHERVWLDMPEDLLAQVLVPREHVPTAPVTAEELLQAGTVTYLRRWPDTAEPHVDLSRGASGLYPAFLTMPQLTHLAAKRYFEINRLPWTEDWTRWPEAVLTATRPSDLAAYFGLMTDPIGREVALPEHDGWTNTLTIKLRGHAPRQLETAGEGPEIEDYNRDISRHATSKGTVTSLSVQALAGPQVRFGSDTGGDVEVSGGDTGDGHADARQPGGRVVAAVQAEAGTQWGRSHETDEGSAEISRATYGGAKHTYRADPVFELTFTRRKGGRVQTDTRYIRVKDGMDLLVPERRVADILPAERGTATADAQRQGAPAEPAAGAQERPRRAYVGGRLPVTSAWPEVLHADDVLEQIISRLRDRRILPPAGVTGGKEQERLLGALRTKFRSEALKNGHGALLDQGRWAWFPVSGFAGSTRYLWVRVYAERIDPAHAHRPRPEVKLTLRGESVREDKDVTLRSTSAGFGGVATARGGEHEEHEEHGGQQGHAGFDYGGGYLWRNGRSETVNTKHTDIIRANPKDTSEEFEHAVHFRVELATTRELPQLLEPVVTPAATHGHALYTAAADAVSSWLDPASVTRRARPDQVWRKPAPWTWHDDGSGEGRGISGEIRFLVPGRLTTAAPAVGTAPLPFTRVYGQNARWEAAGAGSRFRQPPKALVDNLHPWDIPAAGAAQRWTKVAAIGSVQPPDLARDGVWTIPGIDFGTKEGIAYQHHTSHAMLRPSIVELLTNRYLVVVGGRQVRLGMEVARAHPLDIADVLFKARRYQQDDTHEEVKVDQAKGWYHGGGPESGGNAGDNAVLERTPLERHTMDVQRQGGGFSETEEFNREGTRSFRSYRFDVTLVAEAVDGPARRLRVDVPGGVYGMIPLAADGTLADGLDAVALFGPPRTTFADVVEQYPEPIARHPRWTMWGHNGPTPRTSAYAVELPALDLRGVYVPPAAEEAGEGVGSWHWYVGDEAEPTAVTPLTLRLASPGPASAVQAHLRPPLAAGAAHANAVAALDAAPWSAGLRWRADGDDLYVFGPPRTQDPEDVFAAGLRPPGERPVHVAAHVREGGAADSLWVTASRDIGWLRGQASAGEGADGAAVLDRYGWRYDIAAPGGVDVNETLDLAAPHPERREVLFPGGVDGRYVRGVQRVERGRPVGPYLTNPGFSDIRESGTVTKGTAG